MRDSARQFGRARSSQLPQLDRDDDGAADDDGAGQMVAEDDHRVGERRVEGGHELAEVEASVVDAVVNVGVNGDGEREDPAACRSILNLVLKTKGIFISYICRYNLSKLGITEF